MSVLVLPRHEEGYVEESEAIPVEASIKGIAKYIFRKILYHHVTKRASHQVREADIP